ncbi:hypothetical protein [Vulgatibacter incomptus]|uniref:hypothetical protein n=1 Tax=Vulgatibacter incomptus TaxID=1391653 RepID=UPI0006811787|nr:hypothetical protein [Vulgatibacter incomptus]
MAGTGGDEEKNCHHTYAGSAAAACESGEMAMDWPARLPHAGFGWNFGDPILGAEGIVTSVDGKTMVIAGVKDRPSSFQWIETLEDKFAIGEVVRVWWSHFGFSVVAGVSWTVAHADINWTETVDPDIWSADAPDVWFYPICLPVHILGCPNDTLYGLRIGSTDLEIFPGHQQNVDGWEISFHGAVFVGPFTDENGTYESFFIGAVSMWRASAPH